MVAGHEVALAAGDAAARGAAEVVDDARRHVERAPAAQAGAQAPVDVLEIGEEGLLEGADVRARSGIERGAGEALKIRPGVSYWPWSGCPPPRLEPAAPGHHVAGAVDLVWSLPESCLGGGGGPRVRVERAYQQREPVRLELDVVVEQGDVGRVAVRDAGVDGGREAAVGDGQATCRPGHSRARYSRSVL